VADSAYCLVDTGKGRKKSRSLADGPPGSTLGVIAGGLAGVIFYCAESEWRRNYSGLRLLAHHVVFFGLYGLILGLTTGICMGRRFEDADTTTVRVVDEPTMNDERMERM
jgi:hypothetical protein